MLCIASRFLLQGADGGPRRIGSKHFERRRRGEWEQEEKCERGMPRLAQLSSLWGLAVAQAGRGLFLAFGVWFGRGVYCGWC